MKICFCSKYYLRLAVWLSIDAIFQNIAKTLKFQPKANCKTVAVQLHFLVISTLANLFLKCTLLLVRILSWLKGNALNWLTNNAKLL